MERMGLCIRLKAEAVAEYKRVHTAVWPEVLDAICQANITNYSIFIKEPENLLFAYWEYVGSDFAADSARMAENAQIQAWWRLCDPMQQPFDTRQPGEWWARMPEVFHRD